MDKEREVKLQAAIYQFLKKFGASLTDKSVKSVPASVFGSKMFNSEDMRRVLLNEESDSYMGASKSLGTADQPSEVAILLRTAWKNSGIDSSLLTEEMLQVIAKDVEIAIAEKRDTLT